MRVNQLPVPTGYEIVQEVLEKSKRGGVTNKKVLGLPIPSLTSAQVAAHLHRDGSRWNDSNHNGKVELTYEFTDDKPSDFEKLKRKSSVYNIDLIPLTLSQQEFVRKAHQDFADVANLTFTEKGRGTGEGHLTYRMFVPRDKNHPYAGFAVKPNPDYPERQGRIWLRHEGQKAKLGSRSDSDANPSSDKVWRSTVVHELGHAVGLSHTHFEEGEVDKFFHYMENFGNYSVMSDNAPAIGATGDGPQAVSLMIDDIQAVQSIYGANHSTRKGNTTYGFNSNTDREHYSLKTSQDQPLFAVWDGGGWDTLDFSEFTQDQTINLNEGALSSVGGLQRNVGIAQGVTIEEARGGKGKNTLIGNAAFNILRGGKDRDVLYGGSGGAKMWGGEGADTFVFDATSSGKPNVVMDFVSGTDKIDLSGMRRQSGVLNLVSRLRLQHKKPQNPNNPTFFTQPGDVLVNYNRTAQQTLLRMDTTGDGKMDMHINVRGIVRHEDIVV